MRSAWLKYIYIDESGDLGKHGTKYFTIVGLMVDNPKILARIPKRIRRRKLKKPLRKLPELKANRSPPELRKLVLKKVQATRCEILAVVVPKSKIYDYLFEAKDKLYNYFCGQLVKRIPMKKGKLILVIDKKHGNTVLREDFDNYVRKKLPAGLKVEIRHRFSHACNELQVADFVAWSINRKFCIEDEEYFKIIEDKIVNKDEMVLWKKQSADPSRSPVYLTAHNRLGLTRQLKFLLERYKPYPLGGTPWSYLGVGGIQSGAEVK